VTPPLDLSVIGSLLSDLSHACGIVPTPHAAASDKNAALASSELKQEQGRANKAVQQLEVARKRAVTVTADRAKRRKELKEAHAQEIKELRLEIKTLVANKKASDEKLVIFDRLRDLM
jgi:hypothetical protein